MLREPVNYLIMRHVLPDYPVLLQTAHWVSKGSDYYADHLLYERLYDESILEIDAFVEKVIPLSSEQIVHPAAVVSEALELLKASDLSFDQDATADELAAATLKMEKELLERIELTYKSLGEELTLGLDDHLQAMHSAHEGHVYLLGQRNK